MSSTSISGDDHFWIGLYLPEEAACSCLGASPFECAECREKFAWVDQTTEVPHFWAHPTDPNDGELCVKLRHPYNGYSAWAAYTCDTPLKYISHL